MPTELYLDTARLGQISPTAKLESEVYLRIAERESASSRFESLLFADIANASPNSEFSTWRGVSDLKTRLQRLASFPDDANVLLAGRTKTLARIVARLFFGPCRSLLVTDLGWPDYSDLLRTYAKRARRKLVCVELADAVFRDRATPEEVFGRIVDAYGRGGCDGLFLTAVSNTGITLDVPRIVTGLESMFDIKFIGIDGAQHLGHLPQSLAACSDFYFAGTHKWLGSHLPLAVAFYGRRRSKNYVLATLRRLLDRDEIDDPLLRMTLDERSDRVPFGETVNVAPLFAASGAVADAGHDGEIVLRDRRNNIEALMQVATESGWRPLRPHERFRSGILLAESSRFTNAEPSELRCRLQKLGLAVTAYQKGIVRLSAPNKPLSSDEFGIVRNALRSC